MNNEKIIQLSTEELKPIISQILKKEFESLKEMIERGNIPHYLSRKDIVKMFGIDMSSVKNWRENGILQAYQIGGRVYFKASDIESSMIKLER
jgi:hypothetical protein